MSLPQAPRIYLVAAVASNGIIGANGALPWRLPEDLQHFKRVTMGHPVIMGRKTWESLKGPLPGRDNIVVTRTAGYETPGAAVASSLEAALALCLGEPVAFVVGGSSLFAVTLNGDERQLTHLPVNVVLHDISRDGQLLLERSDVRGRHQQAVGHDFGSCSGVGSCCSTVLTVAARQRRSARKV